MKCSNHFVDRHGSLTAVGHVLEGDGTVAHLVFADEGDKGNLLAVGEVHLFLHLGGFGIDDRGDALVR